MKLRVVSNNLASLVQIISADKLVNNLPGHFLIKNRLRSRHFISDSVDFDGFGVGGLTWVKQERNLVDDLTVLDLDDGKVEDTVVGFEAGGLHVDDELDFFVMAGRSCG